MPQLVKGGKNAFAWTKVNSEGRVVVPHDAFEEYGFKEDDIAVLLSGSNTSGGFSLNRLSKFKDSSIASSVFEVHPELENQRIPEGETIQFRNRYFCWVRIYDKTIILSSASLKNYGIEKGDKLLAVRGSDLGIAFIVRGAIIEEAKKHDELIVYQ